MNLAMSLAIKKKRVVVVDLDMRKAATSKYVRKPQLGISSYLNGQCELKDIIHRYDGVELDVIPVGMIPPNPTELLTMSDSQKLSSSSARTTIMSL